MNNCLSRENKALIRRVLDELYNQRNLALIDAVATENVIEHTPSIDLNGRDSWKQYATMFLTAFPDITLSIDDLIAEDDTVVARWTVQATHKGLLRNIPPTGKKITFSGIAIYRFSDKKIDEGWALNDALGLMQQLGVISST
jgi:steroid delta-isomerase-like uncharacterized protein